MAAALGTLSKFGFDSVSPVAARVEIASENLVMREEIIDGNGLKGSRSPTVDRTRQSLQRVSGPIECQPNGFEMDLWLKWIFGSPAANKYSLQDAAIKRFVTSDRVIKVCNYSGVGLDSVTFAFNQGQVVKLHADAVGMSETIGAAGSWTAPSLNFATGPWVYSDNNSLTINGTSVTAKGFEIAIHNHIDKDRFFNSITLSDIVMLDRNVSFRCTMPYGDFSALYGVGGGGVPVVAQVTNGVDVLTLTMPKVVFPRITPSATGRVEEMLEVNGICYKDASTSDGELFATLTLS